MTQPDLHSHSTASDGTLSPTDLVARAARRGVRMLALTDHDTTAGLAEARHAAAAAGLTLVPGVEISTNWGERTIHVLGLGIDPAAIPLLAGLERLRDQRVWRAEEIGRRLAHIGIEGAFAGAKALSNGRLVSRTHFARFLVRRGHASSVREVFSRFLVKDKPGHVHGEWASLAEAVAWIRAAGGQAVIAHPGRYRLAHTQMNQLVGEFREHGGVGLEVASGSHTPDEVQLFALYAHHHGLLASGGSDFHDPVGARPDLGGMPALPEICLPIWRHWSGFATEA